MEQNIKHKNSYTIKYVIIFKKHLKTIKITILTKNVSVDLIKIYLDPIIFARSLFGFTEEG